MGADTEHPAVPAHLVPTGGEGGLAGGAQLSSCAQRLLLAKLSGQRAGEACPAFSTSLCSASEGWGDRGKEGPRGPVMGLDAGSIHPAHPPLLWPQLTDWETEAFRGATHRACDPKVQAPTTWLFGLHAGVWMLLRPPGAQRKLRGEARPACVRACVRAGRQAGQAMPVWSEGASRVWSATSPALIICPKAANCLPGDQSVYFSPVCTN